jgi:hypothetical protein
MNRLPSLFCAAATVAMVAPAIAASPTASVDALVAKMTPELSKQISLSLNPKRSGFKIGRRIWLLLASRPSSQLVMEWQPPQTSQKPSCPQKPH